MMTLSAVPGVRRVEGHPSTGIFPTAGNPIPRTEISGTISGQTVLMARLCLVRPSGFFPAGVVHHE